MNAIDTNVLLRYLLADDPKQHQLASQVIHCHGPMLVTDLALAEALWTLTGKRYCLDKVGVCHLVRGLIADNLLKFENSQVVWKSLRDYENASTINGKSLDFADALIANKAHYAIRQFGFPQSHFYSFDKATAQLKNTNVLA